MHRVYSSPWQLLIPLWRAIYPLPHPPTSVMQGGRPSG